jgi:hypothetical protein
MSRTASALHIIKDDDSIDEDQAQCITGCYPVAQSVSRQRGIRKNWRPEDEQLISFDEFIAIMSSKVEFKGEQAGEFAGIEFDHSEKNVSCFFLPIFS